MVPVDQLEKLLGGYPARGGLIPYLDYRGISQAGFEAPRCLENSSNIKVLGVSEPPLLRSARINGMLRLSCRPIERQSGPGLAP
jgi:hypothetical protein